MTMPLAYIDHYDSFSRNVIDWLLAPNLPIQIQVVAFDDHEAMTALMTGSPMPLVFSPGPKAPADAPSSLALMRHWLGKVPVLGVCLGHQMLGVLAGGTIGPARTPRHGMCRAISFLQQEPIFHGLRSPISMAAYNSLSILPGTFLPAWRVIATSDDGDIQAIAYDAPNQWPAYGFQFHPESFLSTKGGKLAANWQQLMCDFYQQERIKGGTSS